MKMTASELSTKETLLMKEFQEIHSRRYHNFVRDGVVNHDEYLTSNPKVVFLLREANWCDGGNNETMINDLRNGVPKRDSWRNWHVIVRWASAILDGNELAWEELQALSLQDEFRKKQLNRVAVVNIKKYGGGASLDWSKFIEYAKEHQSLIKRQLELYQPDVIVCNGTFGMMVEYLYPETAPTSYEKTSTGVRWYNLTDWPCIVIEMPHFGARREGKAMHDLLSIAWPEIKTSFNTPSGD